MKKYKKKISSDIIKPKPGYLPLYYGRRPNYFSDCNSYLSYLKNYIENSETKLDKQRTKEQLLGIKDLFDSNETSKKIFHILYNTPSILERIVFVNDGSYRTHLINFIIDTIHIELFENKYEYNINCIYSTETQPEEAMRAFNIITQKYEKIFIKI